MLSPVVRHGFVFWEAARNTGAVFEAPISSDDDEMELWRAKARKWVNKLPRDFKKIFDTRRGRAIVLGELRRRYDRNWFGDELAALSAEPPAGSPEAANDALVKATEMARGFLVGLKIPHIQERVIATFGVSSDDLLGASQNHRVGRVRTASMALCRLHTLCTVDEIAAAHGRHYALVVKATERVDEIRKSDREFDLKFRSVEEGLRALVREALLARN